MFVELLIGAILVGPILAWLVERLLAFRSRGRQVRSGARRTARARAWEMVYGRWRHKRLPYLQPGDSD